MTPYILPALITDPATRRDTPVTVEYVAPPAYQDEPAAYVAVLDAAGADQVELPTTRPAPAGTAWVIDLEPCAGPDDLAAYDGLTAALQAFGWTVL